MQVTFVACDVLEARIISAAELVSFDRSTGGIVYALHCVAKMKPPTILWPSSGSTSAVEDEERVRREWSQKVEHHFHDMRRRARVHCPQALLPQFEDQLCEIEANVRGAIT